MKQIWKIKGLLLSKRRKIRKLQKIIFQKSQKLLAENLHERPLIQNIQYLLIQLQMRIM